MKNIIYKRIFLSLLLCLFMITLSNAKTPADIAKNSFPSIVLIISQDSYGQPLSYGSGFFVSNGIVATNLHVVEGAASALMRIVGEKEKYNVQGFVAVDEKRDLILLSVLGADAPGLSLSTKAKISIGDRVFAIGNPLGLEGTFSEGIVSGIRQVESDSILQITAPISPGSSGGPVLNEDGDVIGVAFAAFMSGQNLNFSIPVSYLSILYSNIQQIRDLSQISRSNNGAIFSKAIGERQTNAVIGEKLIWTYPVSGYGNYSFTLRNLLSVSIRNIYCLVVFYDYDGKPLDFKVHEFDGIIPGGLAKRVRGRVDDSVMKMITPSRPFGYGVVFSDRPGTKIEFRILYFEVAE